MSGHGCNLQVADYSADSFCSVYGEFFAKNTGWIHAKKGYYAYFDMPVSDQDKPWAPHATAMSIAVEQRKVPCILLSLVSGMNSQTISQTVTSVW